MTKRETRTGTQEMLLELADRADCEAWTRPQVTKALRYLAVVRIRRATASKAADAALAGGKR